MTYTPSLNIDDLISLHQDGNTSYFLRDGQHSVRGLLRPDQTLQTTYEYNPYGAIRSQTGSTDNAFAFTGRRVEPDSGLMYYRTRYYDPEVGRFLKKDSYKGTLDAPLSQHRYAYVLNNPVNWVDPKGLTAFPSDPTIYYSLLVDPKGISDGDKLSFASIGNTGVGLAAHYTGLTAIGTASTYAGLGFFAYDQYNHGEKSYNNAKCEAYLRDSRKGTANHNPIFAGHDKNICLSDKDIKNDKKSNIKSIYDSALDAVYWPVEQVGSGLFNALDMISCYIDPYCKDDLSIINPGRKGR